MGKTLQTISWNKNGSNFVQISLKFVPVDADDNKSALAQLMVNRHQAITRMNDNPLYASVN